MCTDVIFFDESIEAKLNRYTFRSKNFDTPFLTYEKDKHIKTYVPPSPYRTDLADPDKIFAYGPIFPRLQSKWLVTPRQLAAKFPALKDQVLSMLCRIRLKRKWSTTATSHSEHLSGTSCIFSSYLVITSLLLSHSVEQTLQMIQRQQTPSLSALEVLREEMRSNSVTGASTMEIRRRRKSEEALSYNVNDTNSSGDSSRTTNDAYGTRTRAQSMSADIDLEKHKVKESTVVGLLVSMEILSSLTRGDHVPDEITYR